MRLSTWIPLGLAIVLGLVAAFVARSMMGGNKAGTENANKNRVVVAREDVPPGSSLNELQLTLEPFSGKELPENSFTDISALTGRVATSAIVKGQILVEGLLAPQGAQAGVQNLIPEGMRLITVEVNEFSSLAGMLSPNCRVDILATLSDPETHEMMARTIVENVKVTAVGQRVSVKSEEDKEEVGFRSVTLLVSPEQAESIHVSSTSGRPWMVLRGTGDNGSNESIGVTLAELRSGHKPKAGSEAFTNTLTNLLPNPGATTQPSGPQAIKDKRTITFIRGGKVETVDVDAKPASNDPGSITSTNEIEE